jgi:hypothetical protein
LTTAESQPGRLTKRGAAEAVRVEAREGEAAKRTLDLENIIHLDCCVA